jgi:hypothetical protein
LKKYATLQLTPQKLRQAKMASAPGFLSVKPSSKKYRRRTGKKVHLPSLQTPPTSLPQLQQQQRQHQKEEKQQRRPHSRGHTIHGTGKELSFERARQLLRVINEDTPPSKQQEQTNRRGKRRRRKSSKISGVSSLLSDVWSLQANKPNWMIERPPTVEPVVEVKVETPLESLTVPPPSEYDSPDFINKVYHKLKLHPKASHLEKSLIELHLKGAEISEKDTREKVVQWFKHRYPILLQRDQYVENKAVTSIGRAWRAYQSRKAFQEMLTIQKKITQNTTLIQRYWRRRKQRLLHAQLAYDMSPTVAVVITRLALKNIVSQEVKRLEAIRYQKEHAKEIERERILRERTGLSKMQRLKRESASKKIQSQWNVYCWRKSNDLYFMYKKLLHQNAEVIQKFIRNRLAIFKLRKQRLDRLEKHRIKELLIFNAATKIQRCWYNVRGHRWVPRMTHAINVRDLLGADEDLPWERTGLVEDFFENNNFGKTSEMKYYTGGVYSLIGNFAPNRNLTEGQRWMRVRDANVTLASVYHSVGRLNLANKYWTKLVEESLSIECETRSKYTASEATLDNGAGNHDSNDATVVDMDKISRGAELFEDLLRNGSKKQLNGRTITYLVHLCLVYQCQGKFEKAEKLLSNNVLGVEYEKMMIKVRAADAFYRKLYLTKHLHGWKEVCQEFLWKRQHAIRLFKQKMMGISYRYLSRWINWTKSGSWYNRKIKRKAFLRFKQWLKEWKVMRKMMGHSHEFNIMQTKRTVVRRWYYQAQEWKKQKKLMNTALNNGRMVVLNDKFIVWKRWHKRTGHPWWIAQNKLNGTFCYWENVLRESFNWIRRIIYLEKDDSIEWGTRCIQKYIRGKWGRKKARRQVRVKALYLHMQKEYAEDLIVWNIKATVVQRWYRTFLRQRRIKKVSIQIRSEAEARRLRLRKLRLEVQFYKSMIRSLGLEPYDHGKMLEKTRKHRERMEKVVASAAKYMRVGKKNLRNTINLFGEARIDIKIKELTNEVELEGKASKRTPEQIAKDVERNKQFVLHEAHIKRTEAYAFYGRRESFQLHAKKKFELSDDLYVEWKKANQDYKKLDEEGQVRCNIEMLSKQWKDNACDRIVGLFRGRHARIVVGDQLRRLREESLLQYWGALNVQTTWRKYKSTKIANMKRLRRDYLKKHPRVIALAKKTGRPLGFYEQEVKTVELMASLGLTEERLKRLEEKMQFMIEPIWKRRMSEEKYNKLPTFVQTRIPKRNLPLPPLKVIERQKLKSFFEFMHRSIKDFKMFHCAWKETTTTTFIKMKVAIKVVNAKAKSRKDGGIKHYHLFDLLDTIKERGGSVVPAGKPTYFPKMAVLSPQTWGIWKIPMDHPDPAFGSLSRHGFDFEDDEKSDIASVDHGPTREELYYLALSEDGISDRTDHGLGGLIGGALLGVDEKGVTMRNEYMLGSRQSDSNWSNAFESDVAREADELEEEDVLPDVEHPPAMSALEIEKEEMKATNLLNMVRRLQTSKGRKRRKGRDKGVAAKRDAKEDSEQFSDTEMDQVDWEIMDSDEEEKKESKDETASQLMRDMEEMELDPHAFNRKQEAESHHSHPVHQLPYCTSCRVRNHVKREAQRLCHGCNLPYCIQCYRLSHRSKIYQFHTWTAYEHKLVTYAGEETRKKQDYDIAMLKYLERVNPRQYRRTNQIVRFKWTDGLMQIAGQIFLDKDWRNTGKLDMGDVIELIRELLKKRVDEMPSVRIAVRNAWTFLEHGLNITFPEVIRLLPYYDSYFKHQVIEKLKTDGKKDKLGFDPAIFI